MDEQASATMESPIERETTIHVPKNTAPRDEVVAILDHQFVTVRREGYYKLFVLWKNHPKSNLVCLQPSELQQLHPELFTACSTKLPKSSSSKWPAVDVTFEAKQESNIETTPKIVRDGDFS